MPTTESGPDIDELLREASPVRWSDTTRLLVGLTAVLGAFAVLRELTQLIVPVILAVLLVLVTRPAAEWIQRRSGWRWGVCVVVVYAALGGLAVGVFVFFGARILSESQALAATMQSAATGTGDPAAGSSVASASDELVAGVAGLLVRVGARLLALSINLIALTAFIMGAAFFTLVESRPGITRPVLSLGPFAPDLRAIALELRRIWGRWIYGQVILSSLTFASYFVLLSVLGVANSLAISLLSVIGRFIPYVGATITWAVLFITAFTQETNPFGWPPLTYAAVAVGLAILIDQSFDQLLVPKLFGALLRLPTVVVMVGTIAMGLLMGFFGIFVAAPLMASVRVVAVWIALRVFDGEPG
jgi:predicted PurR-regulated permease PerM